MSTTLPSSDALGPLTGWARPVGPPGLRNHVVALSTVALTDRILQLAAALVDGTLALTPAFERGLRGADDALQSRAIEAIACHPNTGAILLMTHDRATAGQLTAQLADLGKPVEVIALMAQSGVSAAVAAAETALTRLHVAAGACARVPLPLSDVTVALECGGSDASSALCANPAIGRFVDRLIAAGGTAIVSETAEFLGGEEVVRERSETPAIADAILAHLSAEDQMMKAGGVDYRGVNPTQENIEAGLTTLTEKTLGALCKIGRSRFAGCLSFGEPPGRPGLHFMDTPFFSPTSLSGMGLGGAQITLFAMGVFNSSAMPLLPTLRICGNPQTLQIWGDSIDVDVSALFENDHDLDAAADALMAAIRRVSDGTMTCAETDQEGQIILPRTLSAL